MFVPCKPPEFEQFGNHIQYQVAHLENEPVSPEPPSPGPETPKTLKLSSEQPRAPHRTFIEPLWKPSRILTNFPPPPPPPRNPLELPSPGVLGFPKTRDPNREPQTPKTLKP